MSAACTAQGLTSAACPRQASQAIVAYGTRVLPVQPGANPYANKYKGIAVGAQIRHDRLEPGIGQPLRRDLQALLQRQVRIANDANCFALSEASDGAAAGAVLSTVATLVQLSLVLWLLLQISTSIFHMVRNSV